MSNNQVGTTPAERAEQRHKTTQRYIRFLATVAAVLVISFGFVAMIFSVQSNVAAQDSRFRLLDCTTPGTDIPSEKNGFTTGHKCYDENQRRTGVAVSNIVNGIDWTICQRMDQSFDQITAIEPPVVLDCSIPVPPPPTTTTTEGR